MSYLIMFAPAPNISLPIFHSNSVIYVLVVGLSGGVTLNNFLQIMYLTGIEVSSQLENVFCTTRLLKTEYGSDLSKFN